MDTSGSPCMFKLSPSEHDDFDLPQSEAPQGLKALK